MVQTSPKHQENPTEYMIYRPLLQIITNRPPCSCHNYADSRQTMNIHQQVLIRLCELAQRAQREFCMHTH